MLSITRADTDLQVVNPFSADFTVTGGIPGYKTSFTRSRRYDPSGKPRETSRSEGDLMSTYQQFSRSNSDNPSPLGNRSNSSSFLKGPTSSRACQSWHQQQGRVRDHRTSGTTDQLEKSVLHVQK